MGVMPFGGDIGLRRRVLGVVVHVKPPSVLGRPICPRETDAANVLEGGGGFIVVRVKSARIGEDGGLVRHHGVGNRGR